MFKSYCSFYSAPSIGFKDQTIIFEHPVNIKISNQNIVASFSFLKECPRVPVDDPLEGGAGGPERLHAPHTQVLKIQPVPYSLLEQFISVISADLVRIISAVLAWIIGNLSLHSKNILSRFFFSK